MEPRRKEKINDGLRVYTGLILTGLASLQGYQASQKSEKDIEIAKLQMQVETLTSEVRQSKDYAVKFMDKQQDVNEEISRDLMRIKQNTYQRNR